MNKDAIISITVGIFKMLVTMVLIILFLPNNFNNPYALVIGFVGATIVNCMLSIESMVEKIKDSK